MEWHIRKVDEELGQRVKLAALERGVSVQAFIVEALEAAVIGTGPAASAPRVKVGKVVESPAAVGRIVKDTQHAVTDRPNCASLSPSDALRAMREAAYKLNHPGE